MAKHGDEGDAHATSLTWEMQAEWACTKVVHSYAATADRDDTEAFVQLFAPDGIWERPDGSVLKGQAQIRAAYEARVRKGFSRHIVTGVLVKALDKRHAQVSSLAIVLRAPWAQETPLRTAPSVHILAYEDQMLRSDAHVWQIAHRTAKVLMTLENSAPS